MSAVRKPRDGGRCADVNLKRGRSLFVTNIHRDPHLAVPRSVGDPIFVVIMKIKPYDAHNIRDRLAPSTSAVLTR